MPSRRSPRPLAAPCPTFPSRSTPEPTRLLEPVAEVGLGERPVERDRPGAVAGRVVQRLLGARQEARGVERIFGIRGEPDRQGELQAGRLEPRVESRHEVLLDRLRRPLPRHLVRLEDQDPEAVTLPAADDVHGTRGPDELRRDLRQERVAVGHSEALARLREPVHAEVSHRKGLAAPLRAPEFRFETPEDRPLVVEARDAVSLGLLLDDLHEPRVVESDGGRVGEEGEPPAELRGPAGAEGAEGEGQDTDLLVLIQQGNGCGAQVRRNRAAGCGRVEDGDLRLVHEDERLLEPGADDGVVGALGRDGAVPLAAPVASPAREDAKRLRLGVGVPELRARTGQERHGLLAEGVLDARAVEGRGEGAPDLAQAVEEAVGVALALQEPGRRHREGDLDRERLERAKHRRTEGPGTPCAQSDEDADDLAAGRERNRDEAERPREILRRLRRRDEIETAFPGGDIGQEGIRTLRGEKLEEGARNLVAVPALGNAPLPAERGRARELIQRVELHGAEVEVEVGADLLDGPVQNRLELRQATEGGVHAIHERHPLGVAPLGVDEARFLERPGGETGELLDEPHLLRGENEGAPSGHRQEAEDRFSLLERDGEAATAAGTLAVVGVLVVVEGGAVSRERPDEDAVVVDGPALTGYEPTAGARRRPLPEDVLDLLLLRVVPVGLHLVELELALERGCRQADDLVRVEGVKGAGGELEEGDRLLASLHERGDAPLPFQDLPEDQGEGADSLVDVDPLPRRQGKGDAEGAADLVADLHRSADEDEPRLDHSLLAALREEPFQNAREPLLGGGRDDGGPRPADRRRTASRLERDGDGVEEAQGRIEDGPDRLVEKPALGEDRLDRLQEGEITIGRHGCDVLPRLLVLES